MQRWVEIVFDCLPLRIARISVPKDASPRLEAKLERIQRAIEVHGGLNSYYLHNASCTFHFTNDESIGMVKFSFEGTVLTDSSDLKSARADLKVELVGETCSWLTQSVVAWLSESVHRAVLVEFDRYIAVGDRDRARARLEAIQKASDEAGGFVGMYL